jgi:phospholipase C
VARRQAGQLRDLDRFSRDVAHGSLPLYTFLEPRHYDLGHQATSQHPPLSVSAGEELIASVYDALLGNFPLFQQTLLLIVYDEDEASTITSCRPGIPDGTKAGPACRMPW